MFILEHLLGLDDLIYVCNFLHFDISLVTDIADDYIHISATLNSLAADDMTANKKWVQHVKYVLLYRCRAWLCVTL